MPFAVQRFKTVDLSRYLELENKQFHGQNELSVRAQTRVFHFGRALLNALQQRTPTWWSERVTREVKHTDEMLESKLACSTLTIFCSS
jgi:hypothetical protein